jgi:hypothetical protein
MERLEFMEVPQLNFQPQTRTSFEPNSSIFFFTRSNAPVNLRQALDGNLDDLQYADRPCMITERRRITVRVVVSRTYAVVLVSRHADSCYLQWPGYVPWTYLNLGVFDNTFDANRYTYKHIAHRLADVIAKFYQVCMMTAWPYQHINYLLCTNRRCPRLLTILSMDPIWISDGPYRT